VSNKTSVKQPEDPYEFNLDDKNSIPKQSNQITPPKSAGSIISTNNPNSAIPPISYDYLNNIFEEESSADEQQTTKVASSDTKLASTTNEFPTVNGSDTKHSYNETFPLSTASNISQSLSAVMTPPSGGENVNNNHINGLGLNAMTPSDLNEELVTLKNNSLFPQYQLSLLADNKSSDFNASKNKKKPLQNNLLDINSNSYKIFTTIIFDIPLLSNFSRNAKYKRMSLNSNLKAVYSVKNVFKKKSKKLKWTMSKSLNSRKEANNGKESKSNKKYPKRTSQHKLNGNNEPSNVWRKKILSVENLDSDMFNKDYFPYINIQATFKPDNVTNAPDQQNKAHFSPQSAEPLAPPLAPPFLETQQSITALSKPINPPTPQQYSSSVSSPYFQHGKQISL
jgi:hypothetical protein